MPDEQRPPEVDLRDYFRTLRQRKGIIILTAIIAVGTVGVFTHLQDKVYRSSAKILLQGRSTESFFDAQSAGSGDPVRDQQTQLEVLDSQPVKDRVRQKIGSAPPVKAAPVSQTDVIRISATSKEPATAARVANAYADSFIEFRRQKQIDDILAASGELQAKVADLQHQINDSDSRIASLLGNEPAVNTQRQTEVSQRDGLVLQLGDLRRQLDQLQLATNVKTGGAQVVAPAVASNVPISPRPKRDMAMALGLALFLGCGLAFVVEYLDDSIKTKEDLERAIPAVPMLAMIPAVPGWKPKDEPKAVSISEPVSPASEAYRTLRTAIQFLGVDTPIRSLQVTSPKPHEGKTTTVANLGVALARAGIRVVIVCSDLRRPRIHEFFGLSNAVGFMSVLLGEVPLTEALQRVPGVDRLYVLTSGPLPPNPSEVLQSKRASEVLHQLQANGTFLLIDTPPILPVTDGLVLSKQVEGTLVVASAGRTTRKELSRTVDLLRQVQAPLIGCALNGVTSENVGYGYRYYEPRGYAVSNGDGSREGNGAAATNGTETAVKRWRSKTGDSSK